MAIEAALGITVLVTTLAVLMEIVGEVYTRDEMARAARAAARALALDANAALDVDAKACVAIRRELNRGEDFDCDPEKFQPYLEVTPEGLPARLDAGAVEGAGELVLFTITWESSWSLGEGEQVVMGLARRE